MTKPILLDVPMPILTPRLQIRPRKIGEGPLVAKAVNESLDHLKPWMPFAQTAADAEQMEEHCRKSLSNFVSRSDFTLSIYDLEGQNFLGSTGLHKPNWSVPAFTIGYWIHKDHEGKGIVMEAVNALTRYAFEVFEAKRIEIRCDSRNLRSLAVMQRLGFAQEGVLKNQDIGADGTLRDTIITARCDLKGLPELKVTW